MTDPTQAAGSGTPGGRPSAHPRTRAEGARLARSFAVLYSCGAALVMASLLVSEARASSPTAIALATAAAAVVAAALLLGAHRLPRRLAPLLPSLGTALITVVVLAADPDTAAAYALLYLWAILSAFYFFGLSIALTQVALAICAASAALALRANEQAAVYWVLVTGTLLATAWLVTLVRRHSEEVAAHLRAAAICDPLTGLLNRRGFEERIDEELERAQRAGAMLSLLVADLDGLKGLNDRFGHAAGDAALRKFAAVLVENKRRLDAAVRLGGDEFALVLPQTGTEGARDMATRLDRALAGASRDGRQPSATFGAATFPGDGSTAEELLAAADRALYASKAARPGALARPAGEG